MKKFKTVIAVASVCLLFSIVNINAFADESVSADTSAAVGSPDTGGDKGITAAVAGAVISAGAIAVSYKKRRS